MRERFRPTPIGRFNSRFIELYLNSPPAGGLTAPPPSSSAAAAAAAAGAGKRRSAGGEEDEEEEDIALEDWLLARQQQGREVEEGGSDDAAPTVGDEGSERQPLSLVETCCRRIGMDLCMYAAAAAAAAAVAVADDEEEEAEEDEEGDDDSENEEDVTADAIQGLFSLLPSSCLERIALAASLEGNISDESLPLLCQPHVVHLVLVGNHITNDGLARVMYPRLQQLPQTASWEDPALEPQLGGCIALKSLLVSSPSLTPACVGGIGRHLSTVTSLAFPRCFNAMVTITAKEVLKEIGESCLYVEHLDLRGCHWLSEKSLLNWAAAASASASAATAATTHTQTQTHTITAAAGATKKEGAESAVGMIAEVSSPPPPPPALQTLCLDKRWAKLECVREAFAAVEVEGKGKGKGRKKGEKGGGEGGGEGGGIRVCAWEEM